jgi:predicted transcriptional regulator
MTIFRFKGEIMSESRITKSILERYEIYFNIDMQYQPALSNIQRSRNKIRFALINAARFGFISALVCEHTWGVTRAKALEFLGKLVTQGYLVLVQTERAADRRIYVLTHKGAQFASEMMRLDVSFRSAKEPITQVNQNAIMHDSVLSFVLNQGVNNKTSEGLAKPLWTSFLTEMEFKRLYPSSMIKNVDGLVLLLTGEVAAVELEASFKRKSQHETTLLKLKDSLISESPLYDKVFLISCSERINADTQRFYEQLLGELPDRIDRKTKKPLLTRYEAASLREKIIFRTKFIESIEQTFYR